MVQPSKPASAEADMNALTPLRPPGRPETDDALTSSRIDEIVGRIGRRPPGRERDAARERGIRTLIPVAHRIAAEYRGTGSGPGADWWARHLKPRQGMRASPSGTPATMGPGTPYAIAARLACPDRRVIAFPKADQEIAPIAPHTMLAQGEMAAKAAVHDPGRVGIATRGVRQKLAEVAEHLPGRHR